MHRKEARYPSLTATSLHVGLSAYTSSDTASSKEYLAKPAASDSHRDGYKKSDYNSESSISAHGEVKSTTHIGVDQLLGKESKVFGVRLKKVNNIEKGISPPGLGKRTMYLFLEQIENMTAHPHHSNTTSNEGLGKLGKLVKVVTNFQTESQERRGEITDTGWRHKNRNVLASIKTSFDSNTVLSYLLEEKHTMIKTCANNLKSILINAQEISRQVTQIMASSLAFRIRKETLHFYFGLLYHLAGVNSKSSWEKCKSQLDHHSEKLGIIRGK